MKMLLRRVLIVVVLCCQNIIGEKILCDFADPVCMTKGAGRVYDEFIEGRVEGVPSSGTMFVDLMEQDLPTLKYTLHNITFSGLKNCLPEYVVVNTTEKTYKYYLACEHVTMEGIYDTKGELDSMYIEGQGEFRVDHYDYVFQLSGGCEGYIGEDNKLHFQIFKDFDMDIEARGEVVYDFKNLYNGDKEKSDAMHSHANKNWRTVDEIVSKPFMKVFMGIFLDHANMYLKILPVEHYYYQETQLVIRLTGKMLFTRLFILVVLCYQNVLGKKVMCDFEDSQCLTRGDARVYQEFIKGEEGAVPSSGTMHAELIKVDLPTIKYTLRNNTFSGLKNCIPEFVSLKEKSYKYHLACEHITMTGLYEAKGKLADMCIEGNGDYQVDHYNYVFKLSGGCESYTGDDEKLHFSIYDDFKMDIEPRGKVVYKFNNLYNGDKAKSDAMHKFANENWKYVDKTLRGPFMKRFMAEFLNNANIYMKKYPIESYYYQEV
ncbi:uncharacterized protein LOC142976279 [Anticarsia gemmatalis]|uniref:uncharacterized protein LOC142976279 n=1 Tax=Anticarsia gemmatalis TaxID=129554 RepID=UPI003F75732E